MSAARDPRAERARIEELLAERAVQGLATEQEVELEELRTRHPDVDETAFEHAAAAVELHLGASDREPLPQHVRARILALAPGTRDLSRGTNGPAHAPRGRRLLLSGWFVAAAAIVLAVLALRSRPDPAPEDVVARVDRAGDAVRATWKPTEDPDGRAVHGEVVWSAKEQRGYLKIAGLAANDPRVRQYQVWIFDAQRDERYPVDGGVFDVADGARTLTLPLAAGVHVFEPKLFAVTVEKPGGVVVSARERIVALASL